MAISTNVTATVGFINAPIVHADWTITNTDAADDVYLKGYTEVTAADALMTGDATALAAVAMVKLEPGEASTVGSNIRTVAVVCATGVTATVEMMLGIPDVQINANVDLAAIEVASKNRDEVLSRTDRLTVTTSATLVALSSALPATTTAIALIPELSTDDIRMNIGTASATTPKVATTGEVIPITKAVGDTVELFAVGGGPLYVSLRVYVSRVP